MDQLRPLGRVACRAMFGGYGLSQGEIFFGILYKGRLYFKTDPASRPLYRQYGMRPFRPTAQMTLKTYYEVPLGVLEDGDELITWAQRAVTSQGASQRCRRGRRVHLRQP